MKVILASKKDSFWLEVVNLLKENSIDTVYWTGQIACDGKVPEDCFFHRLEDTKELVNLYPLSNIEIFDIENLDIESYFSYLKILDRDDKLGGYSFSVRDRLLKKHLSYWLSVLNEIKPNAIIFSNIPHLMHDFPLYLIAKILNINTVIFNVTPFSGWHYITTSIYNKDESFNLAQISEDIEAIKSSFRKHCIEPYENLTYNTPTYIKKQIAVDQSYNFNNASKLLIKEGLRELGFKKLLVKLGILDTPEFETRFTWQSNFFDFIGEKNKINRLSYIYFRERFKQRLKISHNKSVCDDFDINMVEKYIYIPLHYQPEATTSPGGGIYADQIYMIKQLRAVLPDDIAIIVKEHYSQFSEALFGYRGRDLNFWDEITQINNTYLAPLNYNQKDLILGSLAVATVTGTAGWEAIQYGKYSIVFGEPWYFHHPNAISFNKLEPKIINQILEGKPTGEHTEEFLSIFCKSLIKCDIHNYSDNKIERSANVVSDSISIVLKNEVDNVN